MALSEAALYMQQNPDVLAEYNRLGGTDWNGNKMTADQFAQMHYNNHGKAEGRTWQPAALQANYGDKTQAQQWANTSASSPGSLYSEMNAIKSATNAFGNNDSKNWMGDATYDSNLIPKDFDWQQYALANRDLAAAGADTEDEVKKHYALYGIQENRQWKPAQRELGTGEVVTPGTSYQSPVAPTQAQIDYTSGKNQSSLGTPVGNGWGLTNMRPGGNGGPVGNGWGQVNQGGYTPNNPALNQMAGSITGQVNENLSRNIMPQINSGAQSVGGFGGSRQGVVQANALKDANQGLSNSLTSMYYGDYDNAQNRNLQQQSINNSYNLGMGNLGLGFMQAGNNYNLGLGNLGLGYTQANNNYNLGLGNLGLNAQNSQNSFYTSQRGQDLQQMALGQGLTQAGNQGYMNQGQGIYDSGTIYQNAPWNAMNNFNGAATPYTGYGATSTTNQSANPWAQALGGGIGGAQLGSLFNGSSGMGPIVNTGGVTGLPSLYLTR